MLAAEPIPTFRELGEEVLTMREPYVRGIGRERNRFTCHLLDASFIDKPVTEIQPPEIRAWLRELAERPCRVRAGEEPRVLDKSTANRIQTLASVILDEAVDREIIGVNPCKGQKLKKRVSEADTIERWAYLTIEEQRTLWACPHLTEAEKLAMRIAAGTGMRQGEQHNIELPDLVVDGPNPHANVRLSNPFNGKPAPPKSGKRRRVPLMGDTLVAAREWLELLPSFCPSNPLNLVFPTALGNRRAQGKPLGRSRMMRKIYALAGIPHRKGLHWHALRHTFATNLITGVLGRAWRLEEIQVLMGHSSITITQRYAHLGEDAIKLAVREANAAFARVTGIPVECMPEDSSPWTGFDLGAFANEDEEASHAA